VQFVIRIFLLQHGVAWILISRVQLQFLVLNASSKKRCLVLCSRCEFPYTKPWVNNRLSGSVVLCLLPLIVFLNFYHMWRCWTMHAVQSPTLTSCAVFFGSSQTLETRCLWLRKALAGAQWRNGSHSKQTY